MPTRREVNVERRGARLAEYHALSVDDALAAVHSRAEGLSDTEARERLRRWGPNTLRATKARPAWKILLDQLRSVVVLLLAAAAAVSLVLGDMMDAAAIAAVLLLNTLLGFITEMRARRAMEALLLLEVPRATAIRSRVVREVDARELVPGDVIRLEPGQSTPADARIIDATDLRLSEAALTGESTPVDKFASAVPADTPLPDRRNMIYKGTTIVAGTGTAVIVATGMATELGRIGGLVAAIPEERTPLEKRLNTLGHRLVWVAVGVGGIVAALGVLQGDSLGTMIETGIALAIAAVPEGLPAVATIALAVGVRRMVRRNTLVRRLPSVETLGSVTVVCTDKTGTLTAGEMTATTLWLAGREIRITGAGYEADGAFVEGDHELAPRDDPGHRLALRIGALANRSEVTRNADGWTVRGDPTDAALLVAARKARLERERLLEEWPEVGEVPFSSERMLMATFNRSPDGALTAHVKGAPGRIIELSARELGSAGEQPLDNARRNRLLDANRELASRGLRVLALACGRVAQADAGALHDLTFVGLIGMIDAPAPGVKETIRTLRDAGIRTVMLTGDQKDTAEAIARDLGVLGPGEEVLDGRELGRMSAQALNDRIERVGAFSRVSPENKLDIVSAFQRNGEVAAMLGDGVNDAPALKKADIGVAMGLRGTDVAKEAAAVVLQDDRFPTIAAAVEEGRVIFDNIRKFVFYLFSCNLAEVLVLLGAGVAGLPLPLLPLQILWLNLVTDTFPALALAVEPGEPDVLSRPPRDPDQAILSSRFVRSIAFYAILITAATLAAFAVGLRTGTPERAITLSFLTLALAQAFHLGNARSPGHVIAPKRAVANRYALGAVVLVVALQLLALYYAPLASVLRVVPIGFRDWLIVLPLAAAPATIGQGLKLIAAHRR